MSKELTEKWKNGELEEKFYYILFSSRFGEDYEAIDMFIPEEKDFMYSSCEDVKEVLAPVPSYEDYKKLRKLPLKCFQLEEDNSALMIINKDMCKEIERLEKQLAIATKALKEYKEDYFITTYGGRLTNPYPGIARKALKEMEGVK